MPERRPPGDCTWLQPEPKQPTQLTAHTYSMRTAMPDIGGVEVLKRLREAGRDKQSGFAQGPELIQRRSRRGPANCLQDLVTNEYPKGSVSMASPSNPCDLGAHHTRWLVYASDQHGPDVARSRNRRRSQHQFTFINESGAARQSHPGLREGRRSARQLATISRPES